MKSICSSFFLLYILFQLFSTPAFCKVYYVSLNGSDSGQGTLNDPFATINKSLGSLIPGDTIMVRGGIYALGTTISISGSGTSGSYCTLMAFPGERPILDFSSQALSGSNRGIKLTGSYWHIEGFDITGAGDNGLKIEGGNYNEIVNCAFYRNRDSGLQIGNGSSNNKVINCDSYYNADPTDYGDADGFAAKLDVGLNNYFYGCRAWKNCDDGWDGYLRGADNVSTVIENCWAFENGYLEDGTDPGSQANGNGFKLGGSDDKLLRHDYQVNNCLAFKNKAKGFDQNSNMGSMILYNCTAHNNGAENYKLYKELAAGKVLVLKNCLVLGDVGDIGDFAQQEANSWLGVVSVTDNDFVSIDEQSAYGPRQADGSLPEIQYMHLAESSDLIDAGVDVGMLYAGRAPDLGCFEFGTIPDTVSVALKESIIQIFPNPASEKIWISLEPGTTGSIRVTLADLRGRQVLQENIDRFHGEERFSIDISFLEKGIYVLTLTGGAGSASGMIVVE